MSYEDLRRRQRIREIDCSGASLQRHVVSLLRVADRGLTGARIEANPLDIRHNLAYDAARSAAEAVMAAEGLRHGPGPDPHVMVFEYLQMAGDGRFAREARFFDEARRLRNRTQYEVADLVSKATATTIVRRATQFVDDARQWIAEHHPELTESAGPGHNDPDDTPDGGT